MNMFWRLLVLVCCVSSASLSDVRADEDYRLQPGDTVEVWVGQDATLNRQLVVPADGKISMPLAGQIGASGLTLRELEESLTKKLQPNFKAAIDLNVSLINSQAGGLTPTIFLAGDVAKPGEYPFRRGMTVLHALSMAGGTYRPLNALAQIDPALAADSGLTLQRRLAATLLRSARLNAEAAGRASIEQRSEIADLMADPVIAHAVRQEELLFEARRSVRQREADTRQRTQQALEGQISALKAQLELNNTQKTLALQEQASGKTLIDQGLSPAMKGLAMQRSIAEIDATRVQIEAELAAAQRSLEGTKSEATALEQEWRIQILADREQADAQVEELRRILGAADGNSDGANGAVAAGGQNSGTEDTYKYTVVRMKDGAPTEMKIDELAFVQPGDLIRVVTKFSSSLGATSSVTSALPPAGNGEIDSTLADIPPGTAPSN